MIKFSLKRILENAPYELVLVGDEFTFQTDFHIHYSVSFNKEDIVLGGCDTYQLIIRKIEERRSQFDPKVEATILAIINEFFQSNSEIMLYLCDTSERKGSNQGTGCFSHGLTAMQSATASPFAAPMQRLRMKRYTFALSLTTAIHVCKR